MGPSLALVDQIHFQALEVSARFKRAEVELVEILQKAEAHRVFVKRGHPSLFSYVVAELGLSENLAYSLITVARKSREIPELKEQLKAGKMTFSNARRVASVLTVKNKGEWIQKASELSARQLEKEIVKIQPRQATPERASYVTADRVRLEIGLSEREMLRLRRAQDLLSQSKRRPVSLEETIEALTREFLRRQDPLEKAKRHQVRKGPGFLEKGRDEKERDEKERDEKERDEKERDEKERDEKEGADISPQPQPQPSELVTLRVPLPASVFHQINLRDQRRCTFVFPDGSRCNQGRWLEVHHRVPVSEGGLNALENLTTLCSAHHRFLHLSKDGG